MCWFGLAMAASIEFYPQTNFNVAFDFNARFNEINTANVKFVLCWFSPLLTFGIMLGEAVLLTEWKNNRRYRGGQNEKLNINEYDEYKNKTSVLIPFPPELYSKLPKIVRKLFLFDWEIYEKLKDPSSLILHNTNSISKDK